MIEPKTKMAEAMEAMNEGDYETADLLLTSLIAVNKGKKSLALLHLRRGECRFVMGRDDDCLDDLETSIELAPRVSYAYAELGRVLILLEDFGAALAPLTEALKLNPKDYASLYGRALIRSANQDAEGALDDLEKASKLSLEEGDGHVYGEIREQIQKIKAGKWLFEQAKEVLEQTVKLGPGLLKGLAG